MSDDTQKMIGAVAGTILLMALIAGSIWIEYQWKKAIVRDAIYEAEQAKKKH